MDTSRQSKTVCPKFSCAKIISYLDFNIRKEPVEVRDAKVLVVLVAISG